MEVPMLNEEEFKIASIKNVKSSTTQERFKELLDYYNDLTGFGETEPNAIMHHRVELYGEVCENCGKPHRTSQASFCAACGHNK